MKDFFDSVAKNSGIVIATLVSMLVLVVIAAFVERYANKLNDSERETKGRTGTQRTRQLVVMSMLIAIAVVLMYLDFPLPFLPSFYKIDFSELPVMIGAFTFGPISGILIEFIKILIKTMIKGTSTAFVGEFANFIVGSAFVVPASIIYVLKKTRIRAFIGLVAGTVVCVIAGCILNVYLLLPTYAVLFHMDLNTIISMGTKANASIKDLTTFVLLATVPLNLIKCAVVSLITGCIYKPLSRVIKNGGK